MGSRRAPRPVSAAIRAAVEPIAPATPLAAVQSVWPEVVGEGIAAQSTPVSEREGVITVACRSATWAAELDMLAPETLEKLSAALPEAVEVTGLRFRADNDLE